MCAIYYRVYCGLKSREFPLMLTPSCVSHRDTLYTQAYLKKEPTALFYLATDDEGFLQQVEIIWGLMGM